MAKVILHYAQIDNGIGEVVPARVPQHVRMHVRQKKDCAEGKGMLCKRQFCVGRKSRVRVPWLRALRPVHARVSQLRCKQS